MDPNKNARREFIRKTAVLTDGIGLAGTATLAGTHPHFPVSQGEPVQNRLPRWKGFNVLDFFSPDPSRNRNRTTEEDLKWMRDWGFDFVRVPMAYPSYLDFDRSRDIQPDEVYRVSEEAFYWHWQM
jgi:endoglucanase